MAQPVTLFAFYPPQLIVKERDRAQKPPVSFRIVARRG